MKKTQYGVTNPKKLDYLLALVLSIIATSALWVGIWVTATKTIDGAVNVLELMKKAFLFDLADVKYLVILVQSIAIYGTCLAFLVMLVYAIIKKKARTIPGVFSILFAGFTLALEFGFLSFYANQLNVGVNGLFAVVLGALMVALLVLTYKIFNYTLKLICCGNCYNEYVKDEANGLLKNDKKISGLSSSEAVYDAIYSHDEEVEQEKEVVEDVKPNKEVKPKAEKTEKVKKEKPAKVEPKSESFENLEQQSGFGKANHFTFEQKLKMAKPVARQYFKEIKKYFEEIGFKSNLTKSAETFTYKNTKYAIITTAGKSGLKIYFKLNPADYENLTIPFTDASDKKKYEKTPLLFVVKSDLAVRRAKALMDDIKKALEDENK